MTEQQYTPTTDQVRAAYEHDPESEYHDPIGYPAWQRECGARFDRWLAKVRAEARAEGRLDALQEAREALGLTAEEEQS